MKNWRKINSMTINANKSGIMRILRKKGKCKRISNTLDIPEVDKYTYLWITINQSLKLNDQDNKIRIIEKVIGLRIKLIGRILKTTKGKRFAFNSLIKSKLSYGINVLVKHSLKYKCKWESMIYRLLNAIFNINSNISKSK